MLGDRLPFAVRCYDGSLAGPGDAAATLVVRSDDALRRVLTAPGELGVGRAYVAGDIDIEGDIFSVLQTLTERAGTIRITGPQRLEMMRLAGPAGLVPLPPPPEEARLRGRRHSSERDAAAIAYHYDVSDAFYRLVLGPSMTYSCALWGDGRSTLQDAQAAKHELVCRKLGLQPGRRLLDVGCGWGGMAIHAARHHGAHVVGITVSTNQALQAARAVSEAGLDGRVEIRLQDYREVPDGPYDAISSIGMFEHVGAAHLPEYFGCVRRLLADRGRFLNHGIARPPGDKPRFARTGFMERYVFPDAELHELGSVISVMQRAGFEVRHVENLREHYALTLRAWVANLESAWDDAVAEVGTGRARTWRLYMAAAALNFELGRMQVHQTLGIGEEGRQSDLGLRPEWDSTPLG